MCVTEEWMGVTEGGCVLLREEWVLLREGVCY